MTEYGRIPNEYCDIMGKKDFSNHCVFGYFMLYHKITEPAMPTAVIFGINFAFSLDIR